MEVTEVQRRLRETQQVEIITAETVRKVQRCLDQIRANKDVQANLRDIQRQLKSIHEADRDRVRKAHELDEEITAAVEAKRVRVEPRSEGEKPKSKEDEDCLICQQTVGTVIPTMTCPVCKVMYHATCFSEWLDVKASCPHCSAQVENIECGTIRIHDFLLLLRHKKDT